MSNTIPAEETEAKELWRLQQEVVDREVAVLNLASILSAYSALPVSLQELVRSMNLAISARDQQMRKITTAGVGCSARAIHPC